MEYSRIRYDFFFKKIFSQKEHITRAFLNTVLRDDLKYPIEKISFKPTDFIINDRHTSINTAEHCIIHVSCIDEEGHKILVNIQKGGNKFALPQFLDYQCRNYSSQFSPNNQYKNTVGYYSICWIFDHQPPHNSLSEKIRLSSNETNTDWAFNWQITALYPQNSGDLKDLKQHLKEEHEISLAEWLILDAVTNQEKVTAIKGIFQHDVIKEAFEDLALSNYTENQLQEAAYKEESDDLMQINLQKEIAKAEKQRARAIAKAEEHRAEGLLQQKIAIAKTMIGLVNLETISKATGLSKEILETL